MNFYIAEKYTFHSNQGLYLILTPSLLTGVSQEERVLSCKKPMHVEGRSGVWRSIWGPRMSKSQDKGLSNTILLLVLVFLSWCANNMIRGRGCLAIFGTFLLLTFSTPCPIFVQTYNMISSTLRDAQGTFSPLPSVVWKTLHSGQSDFHPPQYYRQRRKKLSKCFNFLDFCLINYDFMI